MSDHITSFLKTLQCLLHLVQNKNIFLTMAERPSESSTHFCLVLMTDYSPLSHSIMSDSLRPHGLYLAFQASLSMDFSSKNTGVSSYSLLQGNLPNSGIEPGFPALQVDSLHLSHQGSPFTPWNKTEKQNLEV